MPLTVTDLRTERNQADATTNWTGSITPSLGTADPDPIEATGHMAMVVSDTFGYALHAPGGSVDLTSTLVYVWVLPLGAMATLANHGFGVVLSDGTNIIQFNLGGSDVAAFRHNDGNPAYQCLLLDTSNLPASTRVHAGVLGNLNVGAITGIGAGFTTLAKSKGGGTNCYIDIIRFGNLGLRITAGTSGAPGVFSEIAAEDASTANIKAHGICRQLGAGLFGVQGSLVFGGAASASWFADKNVSVVFESRGLLTTRYGITIQDSGGANTATFILGTKVGSGTTATGTDGVSLTAPTGVGAYFDAVTDADVTDVFLYGSTFNGFTGGIQLRTGMELIGCIVGTSGKVEANGATCVNSQFNASTVAADDSALEWDVNLDPDDYLAGTSFSKGTNAHHAIEFGLTSPTTMTLTDVAFSGFNGSNGQNDSTLHVRRTTGTVTINIIGGSTPSYKTDGATVVIVANPVTHTVTAIDESNSPIVGARVFTWPTDNTGPVPFEESVSISRSGSTATVTHTSHGLATSQYVWIQGAAEVEYNGVFQITVTGNDAYTYAVTGTPNSPATGSPISTGVILYGVTDGSGEISDTRTYASNQQVQGRVREGTGGPFYKPNTYVNTIDSTAGSSVTVTLLDDE